MIRIYLAVAMVAAIFLAYITGVHVGNVRCDVRMANAIAEQINQQTQIIEATNETVLHTGSGDIRRILHEKYTIAE